MLLRIHLWEQVLIAMVPGIGLGLLLSPSGMALLSRETACEVAQWVALPGQSFLAMIQMVVIPLVISSIIPGVDRVLDTCRTTVNVSGDLTACVVMDRWIGKELAADEPAQPLPEVS